jgi:hypothetical protein
MKKNSTLLLIIAVLVMGAIAFWVMKTDDSKGGGQAMSDFAFENTDEIDRIIITEINGNSANLERKGEIWTVNKDFRARPENVELLLKTFRGITVQSAVSDELKKNVVANMAARHKKVEIFQNGSLAKTYYVGSPTKDHYGTFMLLEKDGKKSTEPYVMHIPGFNGFLESRFFAYINDWKYSGVFIYDPLAIQEIKVEFTESPESSFIISQFDKKVGLKSIDGADIKEFNNSLVQNYILNYEKIFYNKVAELTGNEIDSILNLAPTYSIQVTSNGEKNKVDFFLKKIDNPTIDLVTGKENPWDENYIYGIREGEKEVLIFQYYALGNVFSRLQYFINK